MLRIVGLGIGILPPTNQTLTSRTSARRAWTGRSVRVCNLNPNSIDRFCAAVPRKVNFVATVQLFQIKPLKWLLSNCGVIPINRVKDDPKAMRSVADTFEACYRVLERGEAIGIFPEGITHDDPQLKTVKTGAARMALELSIVMAESSGCKSCRWD